MGTEHGEITTRPFSITAQILSWLGLVATKRTSACFLSGSWILTSSGIHSLADRRTRSESRATTSLSCLSRARGHQLFGVEMLSWPSGLLKSWSFRNLGSSMFWTEKKLLLPVSTATPVPRLEGKILAE